MTNTVDERRALSQLPVTGLRGVGPRVAECLRALGIVSAQDLLFHLPLRYQDRTRVRAIDSLRAGDEALIEGVVQNSHMRYAKRRSLVATIADSTAELKLRFFHFSRAQQRLLCTGARVAAFGDVRQGPTGLEVVHPEYRVLQDQETIALARHLTPVYPRAQGLGQVTLRRLIDQALDRLEGQGSLEDYVPQPVLDDTELPGLREALTNVHRAHADAQAGSQVESRPGFRRLVFEELLAHHLSLRLLRRRLDETPAPPMQARGALAKRFKQALPFELTGAQVRVIGDIERDLRKARPMHRLLQGDVGSGKTVVAALGGLTVIESGYQVAMMAPTELLAEQHLASFKHWLEPLGVRVAWLSGQLATRERRAALTQIATAQADFVVGTHALFQEAVDFAALGLIIVDEHHRFGVEQRLALRRKGSRNDCCPHQLIMTATPIPRTLAMTAYADLDTSALDELPPGRHAVLTAVVPVTRRDEIIARIRNALAASQQVYWVCTLIEESETLQAETATQAMARLREALPELTVELVHGRMKSDEKDRVMAAFKRAEIDVLVATTVIEVGVDVPRATLMVIENAERFGLAQLHQLRGRIGRGSARSACVLMYETPLSARASARLKIMRETNDGFEIAQRDLELRGPGEVLGTRQTGAIPLRIADLGRDAALFPRVQSAAERLLDSRPQHVPALIHRWLGQSTRYADV